MFSVQPFHFELSRPTQMQDSAQDTEDDFEGDASVQEDSSTVVAATAS